MVLSTLLTVGILPILQSIIASRINDSLNEWVVSDKYEGDPFRKVMRDSFCAAVCRIKGNYPKIQQVFLKDEFDDYLECIIQELIGLRPKERKAYVQEELYAAFREEVLKRQDALEHINLSLAQECLRVSAANLSLIEEIGKDVKSIKEDTTYLVAQVANATAMSGFSACRIVDVTKKDCPIPDIYTKREQLISDLKSRLENKHAILIYSGIKTGKTVLSCLLAKSFVGYRIIIVEFQYTNVINIKDVLEKYCHEDNIIFIFDGVKYRNPEEYSAFIDLINCNQCDNWFFIINSYSAFSEFVFCDCNIDEVLLPSFNRDEISEMIPEKKRKDFADLIYSLFNGQPLLTQMVCTCMHRIGWTMNGDRIIELFTFPNDKNLRKKIQVILQLENDDEYNLLNRLLLLNRSFSNREVELLASINPLIPSPLKCLQNIIGKWIDIDNDLYRVSPLLQKSYKPDLLPQEKKDCCSVLIDVILKHKNLSSMDCFYAFNLMATAEDYDRAGAFYSFVIHKLSKKENFGGDDFSIFRMLWVNCNLPESMQPATKISVWMSHLILPDLKEEDKRHIYDNIDDTMRHWTDNDSLKKKIIQYLTSWIVLNADNKVALNYLSKYGNVIEREGDISVIHLLLIQLEKVKTSEELKQWIDSYVANGMPKSDILCEGAISVVNRLCDTSNPNVIESMLIDILDYAKNSRVNTFAAVICARLIDNHSLQKNTNKALNVYNENKSLLDNILARILMNYSIGLALYNNGQTKEGKTYIESACIEDNIAVACMVALNASCTLAQIYGDAGNTKDAVEVVKKVVQNSNFEKCFNDFEQNAAYGSIAYALAENEDYAEAIEYLMRVENFIWEKRFNKNEDFKNLAMRFDILVQYIYKKYKEEIINEDFIVADYGTFIKQYPKLLEDYKPIRNFTAECLLLKLSDSFSTEENTITIIEHIFDFQKEDAIEYARMMSFLIETVPLCLQHNRKDLIEYLILTTLAGTQNITVEDDVRTIDYESLILGLFIAYYSVFRINVLESGNSPDDEWFFSLLDRAVKYLPNHKRTDEMIHQMLSGNTVLQNLTEVNSRYAVATFNYKRIAPELWLHLLYSMGNVVYGTAHYKSTLQMMDEMIWSFSRYTIREHPVLFKLKYEDYDKYFEKLLPFHGTVLLHKMIQGLYFNIKIEITLPKEIEDIVYE